MGSKKIVAHYFFISIILCIFAFEEIIINNNIHINDGKILFISFF